MKRMLLSCDQVFDALTRGPFPTGQPEDESVEQHLRACHECRRLAEALRPAVALLHEAVAADEALDLPEYQGSLPARGSQPRRLTIARLAGSGCEEPAAFRLARTGEIERRQPQAISAVRFIAASLAIAFVGLLFGGTALSPRGLARLARLPAAISPAAPAHSFSDVPPDAKSLLTLAALRLPAACVPLSHRPVSADQAAEIAVAIASGSLDGLHCCTECHHAGQAQPQTAKLAAATLQNCQLCHRG